MLQKFIIDWLNENFSPATFHFNTCYYEKDHFCFAIDCRVMPKNTRSNFPSLKRLIRWKTNYHEKSDFNMLSWLVLIH